MRTSPWGVSAPPWGPLTRPLIRDRCSAPRWAATRAGWRWGRATVPDAALTLQIRSSTAALEWLYREDLWPAPAQGSRVWSEPLRLFWAPVAWEAYARLFDSFGPFPAGHAIHQKGHWNSWGNFKRGQMDLRDLADRVAGDFRLPILVLDEGWETSPSNGIPNRKTFPHFEEDLQYIRSKGLEARLLAGDRLGPRAGKAGAGACRPALRGRRASPPRYLVHGFGQCRRELLLGSRFGACPHLPAGADAAGHEAVRTAAAQIGLRLRAAGS